MKNKINKSEIYKYEEWLETALKIIISYIIIKFYISELVINLFAFIWFKIDIYQNFLIFLAEKNCSFP